MREFAVSRNGRAGVVEVVLAGVGNLTQLRVDHRLEVAALLVDGRAVLRPRRSADSRRGAGR